MKNEVWVPFLGGAVLYDFSNGTVGIMGGGTALEWEPERLPELEPPDTELDEGYMFGNWE